MRSSAKKNFWVLPVVGLLAILGLGFIVLLMLRVNVEFSTGSLTSTFIFGTVAYSYLAVLACMMIALLRGKIWPLWQQILAVGSGTVLTFGGAFLVIALPTIVWPISIWIFLGGIILLFVWAQARDTQINREE